MKNENANKAKKQTKASREAAAETAIVPKRGRPLELTPQKQKIILDAIREGATYTVAADLAGICYVTLNRWTIAGADPMAPPELRDFCYELEKAKAEGELALIKTINKAARKDWKAAAWQLERRNPQKYGKAALLKTEPQFAIVRPTLTEQQKLGELKYFLSQVTDEELVHVWK